MKHLFIINPAAGSSDHTMEYSGAIRTFAHNAVDLYSDCPSRERAGWLCDSYFSAKTEYCLCYDKALAPEETVSSLRARLENVEIPVLLDSAYFASFLKQDKLNLFPAAAYTERPATACARLCEGKAVVLVAGCPYALIIPSFFAEHFECLDDYASGAVFAGLSLALCGAV